MYPTHKNTKNVYKLNIHLISFHLNEDIFHDFCNRDDKDKKREQLYQTNKCFSFLYISANPHINNVNRIGKHAILP